MKSWKPLSGIFRRGLSRNRSPWYFPIITTWRFSLLLQARGAAVRKLCELLNISPLLSIAAGDAENDISMIEAAGIGIAMYNASDDVKAAATMVTALDNNHDGLARELLDLV